MKPYMRYSLAGGVHANSELWVGTTSFCVSEGEGRVVSDEDVRSLAAESVYQWLNSPSHAAALLHPEYRVMNYGLAYDSHNWRVVAVLETNALVDTGTSVSTLSAEGVARVYGSFTEETQAARYALSGLETRYDPPPVELSQGALARTTFYGEGELRAVFTVSPDGVDTPGSSQSLVNYPNPYAFPDSETPGSESEAAYLFERVMGAAATRVRGR